MFRTLPLTLMTLLVAPIAGKQAPQVGARKLIVAGLVLSSGGRVEKPSWAA